MSMKAIGNLCLIAVISLGASAWAQTQPTETKPQQETRTFFLANVTETNDAMDIQTDLRNMIPRTHVYFVASQGAISVQGTSDEIAQAQKLISELDRRRKVYRLTYSIAEMEAGKQTGTRKVELVIPVGGKTVMKEGSRIPIVTGSTGQDSEKPSSQVQYLDVGLNIEAELEGHGDAVRLRTSVEESRVADEKSGIGVQDPMLPQSKLEGIAMLTQGKPTLLGSLDFAGSGRHLEITVESEPVQ
jgi:type II secretory pathway component GspD/PulD (secretin)